MSHTAEIIAVGTELLLGNIVNTNAQDISQALSAVGVNVFWHTVVGDNPQRLREALEIARKRADVIITTGGLGPTYDDLTKQTICETFGKPLVFYPEILESIRYFFEHKAHIPMPENNRPQAEFPADCVIFDNPVGTAPGCAFESDGVHVLMMPGPPFEMLTMLRRHAVPYLRGLSSDVILSHDIMTFGLGESPMEELMREEISQMENPSLATYAKPSEVRLRATAKAATAEEAERMLAPVVEKTVKFLGNVVYGVDVEGLEHTCFRLLKEQGSKLFDTYWSRLSDFYRSVKNLRHIHVVCPADFTKEEAYAFDCSKILIFPDSSVMTGKRLYDLLLHRYGLQMEMASLHYVLAMTSVMDTGQGFARLSAALHELEDSMAGQ